MTEISSFNLFDFLGLSNLTSEQKEKIELDLYKDVSIFLLDKFVDSLSEEDFLKLQNSLSDLKSSEAVLKVIQEYDPEFENKKMNYLNEYKQQFDPKKFIK